MVDENKIGPIQILAVAFEKPSFTGRIQDELKNLKDQNLVRLVDGIAIRKDSNGTIEIMEKSDLSLEEFTRYGQVIGALIGLGSGDEDIARSTSKQVGERFNEHYEYGLDKEDLEEVVAAIPKGGAAILLMLEHVWAIPLRDSLRSAGGLLIAQDFLSPEVLMLIGQKAFAK